jgi:hypothetical protein
MIVGRAQNDKEQLILLGLSHENIRRLMKGEPMRITRATHGDGVPDGWVIIIDYGETEQALAAKLKSMGVIDEETIVHKDPRL